LQIFHNLFCFKASDETIATAIARLRDLVFFCIGIVSLFLVSACISEGTPALSLPNNKISFFLKLNLKYGFFVFVVIKIIRDLEFFFLKLEYY
jgi:magnesium-transporting ATPase (P-type)